MGFLSLVIWGFRHFLVREGRWKQAHPFLRSLGRPPWSTGRLDSIVTMMNFALRIPLNFIQTKTVIFMSIVRVLIWCEVSNCALVQLVPSFPPPVILPLSSMWLQLFPNCLVLNCTGKSLIVRQCVGRARLTLATICAQWNWSNHMREMHCWKPNFIGNCYKWSK